MSKNFISVEGMEVVSRLVIPAPRLGHSEVIATISFESGIGYNEIILWLIMCKKPAVFETAACERIGRRLF